MKRILAGGISGAIAFSLVLGMAACGSSNAFSKPDVTYKIDATVSTKAEDQISDLLFGVFLEDINYASYALDDNLVSNGSFECGDNPTNFWKTDLTVTTKNEASLFETNPTYAEISAKAGGTLSNSGYMAAPIAVKEGVEYVFTAFIKAIDYNGTIKVSVKDSSKTFAESSVEVEKSEEWVKYKTTLTATDTKDSGLSVVLEFGSDGTLLLDSVMLETAEATGGIKQYMYDAIEGLSPKFIRFPGGCVIEGRTMSDAYDWKNSIGVNSEDKVPEITYTLVEDGTSSTVTTRGEAATRTPNTDIWQTGSNYYLMEYYTGFYEYFLLCDNLGASAIPIVNCGLSCMIQTNGGRYNVLDGRYGNGIEDYIQDALDLVAFAKGDPNSSDENEAYWAQVRVDMGHKEPFDMQYIGIGNEQWGEGYYSYYQQFIEAFQAKAKTNPLYEEVELIVGNGTVFGNCENPDKGTRGLAQTAANLYKSNGKIEKISEFGVHDHHYYMSYADFFANTTLYDDYSREESDRYDVFVGEYSANSATSLTSGQYKYENNSWITALSEAAYMTGLERNGDVVKLAAYAPMFGSNTSGYNQWAADMMFYTNTALALTPNYYVQQLFANNQGSTVLATEAVYSSSFDPNTEIKSLGTETTTIEKLYQIVSYDKKTGDIVIKIVNAGDEDIDINFEISSATPTGVADVTVLQNDDIMAKNTLDKEKVSPYTYTLDVSKKFGYTADMYSVSVIRIHVK